MTTLSEIVNIREEVLDKKFELEAWYRYDPEQKENLVFLSPTVLLEDLELRDGGLKDRGPKEVFSRLTKDILSLKKHSLFQVPEVPYLHMGYGKSSENKKHNMAVTENEAKAWMKVLDLASHKKSGEMLQTVHVQGIEEEPMEVDVTFPTQEDTQAYEFEKGEPEDLIDPSSSGLKRWVKGSYLLFFSILMIFFKKKDPPAANSRGKEEKLGANKISDFLLFWILPYLLNFTQQKVNEFNAHHAEWKRTSGKEGEPFQVPTVEKSVMDIIQDALQSCKVPREVEQIIMKKYKEYYGTAQLKRKYNLLATKAQTPIILVPLCYKVTDMPVEIEHLGTKWREIGNVSFYDEFISKFIGNEEIQTDFLNSFEYLTDVFATDYGIVLPDEDTFNELIEQIEEEQPDILRKVPNQGQDLVSPRLGLIKHADRTRSVCFSYFQGIESHDVSVLFRVISANRLRHFTLAILHGACINSSDPRCKLLSLYPVKSIRQFTFKDGKLVKGKPDGASRGKFKIGTFCKIEFPVTFNSLEQAIHKDSTVVKVISDSRTKLHVPNYEHKPLLQVAYTKRKHKSNLIRHAFKAKVAQNPQELECCVVRAASLDGCLLSTIARRAKSVAVVLAINNTLGPLGGSLLVHVPSAMKKVIYYFVMSLVVAGLPSVYPPKQDGEDEDDLNEDSGLSDDDDDDDDDDDEDEDDESSDDEQPTTSGVTSSGESGIPVSSSSSKVSPRSTFVFKEGKPSDLELKGLAGKIASKWETLGLYLGIGQEVVEEIAANGKDKPFEMLLQWSRNIPPSSTPYRQLYNALCESRVGFSNLARDFCCKKTT